MHKSHGQSLGSSEHETHAVFICHGLWGEPAQLVQMRNALQKRAENCDINIDIHLCQSYKHELTWDGVDVCGDRAVEEIKHKITKLKASGKRATRLSLAGYSLGGLIARYAIKMLDDEGYFNEIQPISFTTFASPWIGIPGIDSDIRKTLQSISALGLGRSGEHLFLLDGTEKKSPLLMRLASPEYTDALSKFQRVDIYANAVADNLVSFLSGALSNEDPFEPALAAARKNPSNMQAVGNKVYLPGLTLTLDENYPVLITQYEPSDGTIAHSVHENSSQPPVFCGRIGPTQIQRMKPWVLSSTYRFASPSVIDAIKIAPPLLPIIVPVIFGYKCGTSARRVKKHLAGKKHQQNPIPTYELPDPSVSAPGLIQSDDLILSKAPEVREALAYMLDLPTNECFSSATCHEYLNAKPLPVVSTDKMPVLSAPCADAAMSVNTITSSKCNDTSPASLPQFADAISQAPDSLDPAPLARSSSCSSNDFDFSSTLRKKLKFTPSLPSNPLKAVLRNSNKQEEMIKSIRDALGDKLRIHLAFLPGVWNSHAVIVCQFPDRKGLEYHEQGRRVIEHWAEHFEFFGRVLQ